VATQRQWLVPIFVLAAIPLLLLAALILGQTSQPIYQGDTLAEWLDDYEAYPTHDRSYQAIRAIGTNALPSLLRWTAHEPSDLSCQLNEWVSNLPPTISEARLVRHLAILDRRPGFVPRGFELLGYDALRAVPELDRLMHAPDAPRDGYQAATALAWIGPAGLRPLMAAAGDPKAGCRVSAITALGYMVRTDARPALPLLRSLLTNADENIRTAATNSIEFIQREALTNAPAP
jgi:hypothetical protein